MINKKINRLIAAVRNNLIICIAVTACVAIVVASGALSLCVKNTVNKYFESNATADIIINSNDGFTANDVELIKDQTSADITGVFYADCRYTLGNSTSSLRVFSKEGNLTDGDIVSGTDITAPNQCVVIKGANESKLKLGDVITVESDSVKVHEFTVVGVAEKDDTDFENAVIVDNSVFTFNYYNRLLLNCDFLRKYNTYSDQYLRAVADVISRLDNIAINRLTAIKSGDYDYRLLNIARYDKELADKVDDVYSKKDELEITNRELAYIKRDIDRTEQLIAEKREQLAISSETIYETISPELKAHEEKLLELNELKQNLDALNEECSNLESEYKALGDDVSKAKLELDAIADKTSLEYTTAKADYDALVKKHNDLKSELDKKKSEYTKKKSDYDKEFAKYDSAYSASKETYDKLMSDTGISGQEIVQMSLMNLKARAEYNQELEAYNAEYDKMQTVQNEVINEVNMLYSSYAKLWYFSDRTIIKEYITFEELTDVLGIVNLVVLIASIVLIAYLSLDKLKGKSVSDKRIFGFSPATFKANLTNSLIIAVTGMAGGFIIGYLITMLAELIIILINQMSFIIPVISTVILLEVITVSVLSMLIGNIILSLKSKA